MATNKNLRQLETLESVFNEKEAEREKNIAEVSEKIAAAKTRAEKAKNEKESSSDPAAWKRAASEERDALDEVDFFEAKKKKLDGPVYTEDQRAQSSKIIFDVFGSLRNDYVTSFIKAIDNLGEKYEVAISGAQMALALAQHLDKLAGCTTTFEEYSRIAQGDTAFANANNLYKQFENRVKNNPFIKKP